MTSETKLTPPDYFDEAGYLRLNPDVRQAVESGRIESGYAHYVLHGSAESRALPDMPREPRNVMLSVSTGARAADEPASIRGAVDTLIIAPNAGLMIVGWIDDVVHPLGGIRISGSGWRAMLDRTRLVRVRRIDVEKNLGKPTQHLFGFFGFLQFDRGCDGAGSVKIEIWQKGGALALDYAPVIVTDAELRNIALSHLASASFFGNPSVESKGYLDEGFGTELVKFNSAITRRIVSNPYVERLQGSRQPSGSIVVCLYGKPEFFFLQSCLFSGLPGIEDYEFIYVLNSPHLAETLLREAHAARVIYGLPSTIVVLSGNAGFGAANNAAAQVAQSDRLLIVNPDVFPRDRDWAKKHTDLLESGDPEHTRLFGVPLYYDDGSLMHGGMYFDADLGLAMATGAPVPQRLLRVEHYGKGTPAACHEYTRPRPVPAVTGAFISIGKQWFEQLGGFTEDFIFGHYEDADLCLKSIQKGTTPWLHEISMWHLEGKGSTRELPHEGASMINRWLFTRTWEETIDAGLLGPAPSRVVTQTSLTRSTQNGARQPPEDAGI